MHTSRRCLCRNQLFQPSPVFARRREVTFLCRGDLLVPRTKTKTIGPRSFATSGPALWNNLPDDLRAPSLSLTVFKQRLESYLFKQCWSVIQPELTFAATFQLMHLHSSVRSFASKEVTFTLHYITMGHPCPDIFDLHHASVSPLNVLFLQNWAIHNPWNDFCRLHDCRTTGSGYLEI